MFNFLFYSLPEFRFSPSLSLPTPPHHFSFMLCALVWHALFVYILLDISILWPGLECCAKSFYWLDSFCLSSTGRVHTPGLRSIKHLPFRSKYYICIGSDLILGILGPFHFHALMFKLVSLIVSLLALSLSLSAYIYRCSRDQVPAVPNGKGDEAYTQMYNISTMIKGLGCVA